MSAPAPSANPTFTLFPALPYELRALIWQRTLLPRCVEINYDEEAGFTTTATLPTTLAVNKESREIALPQYPPAFKSLWYATHIRFNFALDTLYIDSLLDDCVQHFFALFGTLEIENLRYLALHEDFSFDDTPSVSSGLRRIIKHLTGLKELLFVVDVERMTKERIGCGQHHDMELFDQLPHILTNSNLEIEPVMTPEEVKENAMEPWEAPFVKEIYGWRRCPAMTEGTPGLWEMAYRNQADSLRIWNGTVRNSLRVFFGEDDDDDMDDDDGTDDDDDDDMDDDDVFMGMRDDEDEDDDSEDNPLDDDDTDNNMPDLEPLDDSDENDDQDDDGMPDLIPL